MDDLQDIISAYLIAQGAHTGGHFYEAGQHDVPIELNAKTMSESWKTRDKRKNGDIHGAGFYMQDRMRDEIDDHEMKKKVATVNALIKAFYLTDGPGKLSGSLEQGGDIRGMEKTTGNHYVKPLIALSILEDIRQAKSKDNGKLSYGFDVVDGAPGGRVTYRW